MVHFERKNRPVLPFDRLVGISRDSRYSCCARLVIIETGKIFGQQKFR